MTGSKGREETLWIPRTPASSPLLSHLHLLRKRRGLDGQNISPRSPVLWCQAQDQPEGGTQSCEHSHDTLSAPPGLSPSHSAYLGLVHLEPRLREHRWTRGSPGRRTQEWRRRYSGPEVGKRCFQGHCWGPLEEGAYGESRGCCQSGRAEHLATLFSALCF